MCKYPWPGNVRELEHAIGSACMLAKSEVITEADLPERIREHIAAPPLTNPTLISFDELQSRHLQHVLREVGGSKTKAAAILGISRQTLYEMLARNRAQPDSPAYTAG
jgi:transcriptional regulator of acetoin/glycerol metabolism